MVTQKEEEREEGLEWRGREEEEREREEEEEEEEGRSMRDRVEWLCDVTGEGQWRTSGDSMIDSILVIPQTMRLRHAAVRDVLFCFVHWFLCLYSILLLFQCFPSGCFLVTAVGCLMIPGNNAYRMHTYCIVTSRVISGFGRWVCPSSPPLRLTVGTWTNRSGVVMVCTGTIQYSWYGNSR